MSPLEAKTTRGRLDGTRLDLTDASDLKTTFSGENAIEWHEYCGVALIYHLSAANTQLATYNDT